MIFDDTVNEEGETPEESPAEAPAEGAEESSEGGEAI